jgi:hypothetical protein
MKRKIILLLLIFILLFIGVYVYFTKYSRKAKIGNKNRQNIEQIRIGMDKDRVTKIMGDADTIYFVKNINSQFFNKKVFSYYRGPGIYGYLQIIIDTEADTVIKILNIQE